MKFLLSILIFLGSNVLWADGLADLRSMLQKLQGQQPIQAKVKTIVFSENEEDKVKIKGSETMTITAEQTTSGLSIKWSQEDLLRLDKEVKENQKTPGRLSMVSRATNAFSAPLIKGLLSSSNSILRTLEDSKLTGESKEQWNGQAARLLVFSVTPTMSESQKKAMKSYAHTMKIWIDEMGVPLASEEKVDTKGSRFFISFSANTLEKELYKRVGDRLVITERESQNSSNVSVMGGNSSQTKFLVTIL